MVEEQQWVFVLKKRTINGLNLTSTGADEPNIETVLVEATGRNRTATGLGPKRGWNEVVVTCEEKRRIGWFPWNSKQEDCWIIWDLGAYGPPEETN